MTFTIKCTKKAGQGYIDQLWCFDYTFEDGTSVIDEPLMAEATAMIDAFLEAAGKTDTPCINVTFETEATDYDIRLNYVKPEDEGSIYTCTSPSFPTMKGEVWLCPVLESFFPDGKPANLYVTIAPSVAA